MIKTLSDGFKNLPSNRNGAGDLLGKGINLSRQDAFIHRDVFAFFAKIIGTS